LMLIKNPAGTETCWIFLIFYLILQKPS